MMIQINTAIGAKVAVDQQLPQIADNYIANSLQTTTNAFLTFYYVSLISSFTCISENKPTTHGLPVKVKTCKKKQKKNTVSVKQNTYLNMLP